MSRFDRNPRFDHNLGDPTVVREQAEMIDQFLRQPPRDLVQEDILRSERERRLQSVTLYVDDGVQVYTVSGFRAESDYERECRDADIAGNRKTVDVPVLTSGGGLDLVKSTCVCVNGARSRPVG